MVSSSLEIMGKKHPKVKDVTHIGKKYWALKRVLLFMEEILHQLRLVRFPHYSQGFYTSQVVCLGFFFQQQ